MTQQTQAGAAHDEARRHIEIRINGKHIRVESKTLTGAELKATGGISAANHLFLDLAGPGDDPQIRDAEKVHLKSGMAFYDVPVGNLGAS